MHNTISLCFAVQNIFFSIYDIKTNFIYLYHIIFSTNMKYILNIVDALNQNHMLDNNNSHTCPLLND